MRLRFLLVSIPLLAVFSLAQETNFSAGPQYLITSDPMFLRSIATPSLSLSAPLQPVVPPVMATTPSTEVAPSPATGTPSQTDFGRIYWGAPTVPSSSSVIEISSAELPANLPASIFDPGVSRLTNAQTLEQRGYGITLAEVAAYTKAHRKRAAHVFTNEDLAHLPR